MAVLTDADYRDLHGSVYRLGDGKEELNALAGGLPNSTVLRAAFQAIEDAMTTQTIPQAAVGLTVPAYIKARVDLALGRTTTATGFRKIFRVWLRWRDRQGG